MSSPDLGTRDSATLGQITSHSLTLTPYPSTRMYRIQLIYPRAQKSSRNSILLGTPTGQAWFQ